MARATSTSAFGVGRRENHDASDFYARFTPPELSDDDTVAPISDAELGDPFKCDDATKMQLPDNCVALVVTSPPYFAGKQYEEALGHDGIPATYKDYLELLFDVFAQCKRVLEPGGRIAVNVANLGRKPYRSLSSDVIAILQDRLGLLVRGEVIWKKGEGASGSCAWGSFRSAANPVLRDLTERVIIASKGRFDRARPLPRRQREGLPWASTLTADEFMEATLDVWELQAESARRVRHPAPFPVELPERLIHLYTYEGDLVLDPFMGSGSAMVAAARTGRRYVGYDTDADYVEIARARVVAEGRSGRERDDAYGRAVAAGKGVPALARAVLEQAGFTVDDTNAVVRGAGVNVSVVASDTSGRPWYFDVTGSYSTARGGLAKTDTLLKCLGRAHVIARAGGDGDSAPPLVLLTSHLPRPRTDGWHALHAAGPGTVFDAVEILSDSTAARLATYARAGALPRPLPGFWTEAEVEAFRPARRLRG